MKWKDIVTDYLTFTRKERIGIITVLFISAMVIFLPSIFPDQNGSGRQIPDTTWMAAIKKLEQKEPVNDKNIADENDGNATAYQFDQPKNNYYNNKPAGELFYFDPNTISKDEWLQLGLRDKTIQTIQNYLGKAGRFKKAEDLKRVYGLHKDEYERLAPYVKIKEAQAENRSISFAGNKNSEENKTDFKKSLRYSSIDINTADTSAFISLPGIGSKLATRIVNFRDRLGGFYSIDQVGETYGLPDSAFQKIKEYLKLETAIFKKININMATVDELKVHPYIKWNLANPIVAYRIQHGPFAKVEDIKKLMLVTDDVYNMIAPYLSTN